MWATRTVVALWVACLAAILLLIVGVGLVVQAYVPPADILSNSGPIPFFQTIKPLPFGLAACGAVVAVICGASLIGGRVRNRW